MKLLFLTSRFPYPIEKGDKLRAFYFIKYLSRYHDIYLFAINDKEPDAKSIDQLKPFCKAIHIEKINVFQSAFQMINALPGTIPLQVAYFTNERAKKKLRDFINQHQPEKVFCHLIRMAEYSNEIQSADSLLDYMDAFSKGMERLAKRAAWWKKLFIRIEEKRLKDYESKVFDRFRSHLIISKQDAEFIDHPKKNSITIVPNGVDFNYYAPQKAEKKYDLLFMGNMAYPPNIEAVIFTVNKILPLVKRTFPKIKLMIAGATPTRQVLNLESENVIISGWLEDVRPVFSSSKIMIAPMLISIGLQNKILQAMAMKIPCIISRLANNAIGAPLDCVCVAEHPEEYAMHITDLLNHLEKATQIAENAFEFVKQNFDWEKNLEKVNRLI